MFIVVHLKDDCTPLLLTAKGIVETIATPCDLCVDHAIQWRGEPCFSEANAPGL
jgi:hypothetical protein